ncbi:MAG: ATP-binding protein, partial [Pseudomonadota bacterium]
EKFVPADQGRVAVRVLPVDGAWTVEIVDNGPGVPEEHRDRIFDRFFQSGQSASGNPTGTGLGLAISRMIVEHVGGRIWCAEAAGGGACFAFSLPRSAAEAAGQRLVAGD